MKAIIPLKVFLTLVEAIHINKDMIKVVIGC